uniref:E3 ubiquitin-protein ligase TRIM68-like n=1 Tax=Pelodiscus sinensis TaxID=13735 RepID=K7FSN6_PELSI|nr:E3 ubiquitin-protein ligase TRIM68-like [Pelodiscus sinensis]|eukprot:XP_014429234.1 E3 ubiquitin-protein ligase TRIM68-like [Pelodiscus sinensis]
MVYAYQEHKALEMVEKILDGINRKDLSQRVKNDRLEFFPDSEEAENEKLALDMCDRFFGTQKREVTLDPDTAFPTLLISQDRKSVKLGDRPQYFPFNAERFDFRPCVLGAPAVSRGLLEWEVEVGAGKSWGVGAAKKAAERTGAVYISAEQGFWGLELSEGEYHALSAPKTKLHLPAPLRRVKVQLDFSLQRLSFYNGHTAEHLFTFNYPFPEMVPFFMTWDQDVSLQLCS